MGPSTASDAPPLRLRIGAATSERIVTDLRVLGASFVSQAVDVAHVSTLLAESEPMPFRTASDTVGDVVQRAEAVTITGGALSLLPRTGSFVAALEDWLAQPMLAGTGAHSFRPDEATWMRYRSARDGISPHLDGRRYRLLVVILTLHGRGELSIVGDRSGRDARAAWVCQTGDLVLLRGPGLFGAADERPLHRVATAAEGRTSLTLRMTPSARRAA